MILFAYGVFLSEGAVPCWQKSVVNCRTRRESAFDSANDQVGYFESLAPGNMTSS